MREYGDIVRLRLANRVAYLLNHPDYMEYVLVTNHRNFVKNSFFWRQVKAMLLHFQHAALESRSPAFFANQFHIR